jgi:membrane protein
MRSLWELVRLILREAMRDRITGEAAKTAYYFFLSLFPLILALFALTGIFGGAAAFDWIMGRLERALPGEAATYLEQFVREVTGESRPGILSFSILFTLWSASNIFTALGEGLNRMYDLEEGRPWWKRRLVSLAALVLGSVLLVGGSIALLAGPGFLAFLGLGPTLEFLRLPLAIVMLVLLMWLIYFLLPARDMRDAARPTLIGAVVGTGLWLLATLGFRVYVSQFGRYDQTYGFVGGIILLLLWLYLTALAILFGGEVAATIQQHRDDAWEVGQAPRKRSE